MIIVVMGVAGAGKTTIGRMLAEALGWPFYEGDDYHPSSNVAKMSKGTPLGDEDRWPWLDALREVIDGLSGRGRDAVMACSALKQAYRERLQTPTNGVRFVHLKGDFDTLTARLSQRTSHYMQSGMLESQFEALEEPDDAIAIDVAGTPEGVVAELREKLGL